jgi:hypothetical protein
MLQGRLDDAGAVMGKTLRDAAAQKVAGATQQPGAAPAGTGKRKGAAGKPAAKKVAKRAATQANKGTANFQFDVFGSKL